MNSNVLRNNLHYDDEFIKRILYETKSIAVIGLSDCDFLTIILDKPIRLIL